MGGGAARQQVQPQSSYATGGLVTLTSVPMLISSIMPTVVGVVKEGVRSFTSPIVMTAVPVPTKKNCGASRAWGREEERERGEKGRGR